MSGGRAVLVFYGHNTRECGHELPERRLRTNVALDLRTAAGTRTARFMMDARLAWLLEEGMDVPVRVDPASGLAAALDVDALAAELAHRAPEVEAAHREQTSVFYDLPRREELAQLKELPGELLRGLRRLRRR